MPNSSLPIHPVVDLVLVCPACRAKQSIKNTCRRCGADLQLLASVKRRIAWLMKQRAVTMDAGRGEDASPYARELRVLVGREKK